MRALAVAADRLAAGRSPAEAVATAPASILLPLFRASGFLSADALLATISARLAVLLRSPPTDELWSGLSSTVPDMTAEELAAAEAEDVFTPPDHVFTPPEQAHPNRAAETSQPDTTGPTPPDPPPPPTGPRPGPHPVSHLA